MTSELFIQMCITGIVIGLIYVLISLGITLIFGVMRVINFVHGEMMMLSAYGMYFLYNVGEINFVVSLFVCLVGVSLVGIFFQRYLYKRLHYEILNCLVIGAGASYALKSSGWLIFGPEVRDLPTVFPGMMRIFGTPISKERAAVCIICIVLTVGLYLFLKMTKTGKSLRAVEQDPEASEVMGINIDFVNVVAFIVGSSLAAVAGALVGMLFSVDPEMGSEPLVKSFMVILIGGMGSIPGAIIAGLLLGFIDSFTETMLGGEMSFIVSFALLMTILAIRPKGFLGYEV